jgi:hypothetical protein
LYELVKGRYRRGSRLLNSAYVITMLGRSYRPQQRPGAPSNSASTDP